MQLTTHTDYALRVMIYLGLHTDRLVTISELAEYFAISQNHLVKVVHKLGLKGFIFTQRGKGGGIRLARPASEIGVGDLVRQLENHFHIAECFDPRKHNQCRLQPQCGLIGKLHQASEAFLGVLDEVVLSDLIGNTPASA